MSDANAVALLTDGIGVSLGERASRARHHVALAAPFIKRQALARLLVGVAPEIAVTIFTRWRVDEIAAGASDLEVFDFVRERSEWRLLLHPRLHAKVLLIDDQIAAVGSANVTDAALGFGERPNAEVTAVLQPVPNRLFLFFAELQRDSVAATEDLRRRFADAATVSPPPWTSPVVEITGNVTRSPSNPFPRFRHPERLYQGYVSIVDFSDPDARAAILDDLVGLALPDGLDEPSFRNRVGAVLLASEMIAAFDEFVSRPRYFGEMAEWLRTRGVLSDRGQEDRKRYLQTLIRWLRHFLPNRYRLEEPSYSELFGRVEGWVTSERGRSDGSS